MRFLLESPRLRRLELEWLDWLDDACLLAALRAAGETLQEVAVRHSPRVTAAAVRAIAGVEQGTADADAEAYAAGAGAGAGAASAAAERKSDGKQDGETQRQKQRSGAPLLPLLRFLVIEFCGIDKRELTQELLARLLATHAALQSIEFGR